MVHGMRAYDAPNRGLHVGVCGVAVPSLRKSPPYPLKIRTDRMIFCRSPQAKRTLPREYTLVIRVQTTSDHSGTPPWTRDTISDDLDFLQVIQDGLGFGLTSPGPFVASHIVQARFSFPKRDESESLEFPLGEQGMAALSNA